jgi:hypothetical protein
VINKKTAVLLGVLLAAGSAASAQFKPEDLARDRFWEGFLSSAKMTAVEQMGGVGARTNPYKMSLEKDGESSFAVWKNPEGRIGGVLEGWKWEIAAYRLDRFLGLNMVPVTVERSYAEKRGSLQLWAKSKMSYKKVLDGAPKNVDQPPSGLKGVLFNRGVFLQRAFDNLIANEDRHANNLLLTEDWRIILIDHSRSFRTSPKFVETLLYTETSRTHPGTMTALPEAFVEKLKALTAERLREIAESYLTDKEIAAVLVRRDLILKEIDRLIEKKGRAAVIY